MSVYFAKVNEFVKIGYSAEPWKRVSTITYGAIVTPDGVEPGDMVTLLGWYPGGHVDERAAHLALGQHYVCGEWFLDCPEVRQRLVDHPDHVPATTMSGAAFMAVIRGMDVHAAMETWPACDFDDAFLADLLAGRGAAA